MKHENKNLIKLALTSILMGGCICGIAYALITQPKSMGVENQTVYTTNQTTGIKETKRTVKLKDPKLTTTTTGSGSKDSGTEESSKGYAKLVLKGFASGDIRQEYANYAYEIGGENLLYLILCENGGLVLDLQSRVKQSYGREKSYGLCQLGLPRKGVDKERFLTDYKYQLDTCWKYRQSGTPFYGPQRKVNGKACYIRASKQVLFVK